MTDDIDLTPDPGLSTTIEHQHIWAAHRTPIRCEQCGKALTPWWKRARERVLNWWASLS